MNMFVRIRSLIIVTFSAWAVMGSQAAMPGELLQQGLYAEEIEGDLPAAIGAYEAVIADPSAPTELVAQALYRQGMCYVRLGNEAKAAAVLERLVAEHADQAKLVEKARPLLENLRYFDPASLMPPDTMVYMELGSPGRQVEALLNMLQISPSEDPLAPIMRSTGAVLPAGPAMALTRFFNPSMLAELKKVRSLAVGCPQFDLHGSSSFLCIMHPGESDALRGMIIAGLSVAGAPSEPIEGMTVLQIPDGPAMAYDDKVIFMAYPRERLVTCINQYKGIGTEPSLASGNPTFRKIDKLARQRNAATLWIDVDTLFSHVQHQDLSPKFRMAAGMLNLAGIDDLLLTHSIEPDGIALSAMVNLKEGVPNMAYELIKTPAIASAGLEGVPPDAFYLMSFALSTNNPAQFQQLQQLLRIGNGMPLPVGFLENIEQAALFALPGEAKSPEGMPFRPGLVLTCRDTGPVAQLLRERLAEAPDLPPLQIVETNGSVVLAFEPEVIDASLKALGSGASVLEEGVFSAAVQSQLGKARKIVLVNAGGMARLAGIQSAFHSGADDEMAEKMKAAFARLAEQVEPTTLAVSTVEQPESLTLQAKLSGIPHLSELAPAIAALQNVMSEVERQQAQAWEAEKVDQLKTLLAEPPARVVETATPPVIDGEVDAVWNAAEVYDLTKTIYVNQGPENQIAGSYRMLWDAEKLYVLIDVTDSSPAHNPDQIWQFNDGIELYLDATDSKNGGYGDTEHQFGLVWSENAAEAVCVQGQGRTVHSTETAMKNTGKGYCFEVAFPWSELGTKAEVGARIGVEVQVNDNRGHGGRDAKISWHDPYDQAWLNPQYFGRAELVAAQ